MIRECIYQHHLLTCICYCWSLTISSFSKVTAAAWHRRFLAQSCMSVLSEKLIAFLGWIIYLAAFKTCASLAQEVFYNTKVAHLKAAWRCRDHGGGRSSSFRSKPGTTVKGTSTRHASNELLPRTSSSERSRKFRNSHAPTKSTPRISSTCWRIHPQPLAARPPPLLRHWLSLQAGCRCRPPQWPRGGLRLRRRRRRRPTCSCCLGSDAGWFPKNKGHPDDLMLPNMAGKATASMAKQDRHRRRRMRSRSGHWDVQYWTKPNKTEQSINQFCLVLFNIVSYYFDKQNQTKSNNIKQYWLVLQLLLQYAQYNNTKQYKTIYNNTMNNFAAYCLVLFVVLFTIL